MTLSRIAPALAVLCSSIISWTTPVEAQLLLEEPYTPVPEFPVTVNELVTRVPITMQQLNSLGGRDFYVQVTSYGPNIVLCTDPEGGLFWRPELLQQHLRRVVLARTIEQLRALIQQIDSQPDRLRKMALIFDIDYFSISSAVLGTQDANANPVFKTGHRAGIGATERDKLRTGQEVAVTIRNICLTTAQADQINAEGLRVLRAVVAPTGVGQGAQKPVAPGAVQQQRRQ